MPEMSNIVSAQSESERETGGEVEVDLQPVVEKSAAAERRGAAAGTVRAATVAARPGTTRSAGEWGQGAGRAGGLSAWKQSLPELSF